MDELVRADDMSGTGPPCGGGERRHETARNHTALRMLQLGYVSMAVVLAFLLLMVLVPDSSWVWRVLLSCLAGAVCGAIMGPYVCRRKGLENIRTKAVAEAFIGGVVLMPALTILSIDIGYYQVELARIERFAEHAVEVKVSFDREVARRGERMAEHISVSSVRAAIARAKPFMRSHEMNVHEFELRLVLSNGDMLVLQCGLPERHIGSCAITVNPFLLRHEVLVPLAVLVRGR